MIRKLLALTTLVGVGAVLSACGGGGGKIGSSAPATAPQFEAQFGSVFATDYQASNNSEPHDVAPGDVIAVNPTAEPVPLPGT